MIWQRETGWIACDEQGNPIPCWWNGQWMIWHKATGWIACDEQDNPIPEDQPKPSGPPALTEASKERYRLAQLAQEERLREQAELRERHMAEANYGMATSARPPLGIRPPPV